MKKVVLWVLGILYFIIVVLSTVCLFTMNKNSVCEIGNYALYVTKDVKGYKNETLLLTKNNRTKVKTGDKIIFYNTYIFNKVDIDSIKNIEKVNKNEDTYELSSGNFISSNDLIGRTKDTIKIAGLAFLFELFTSKLGFLFLVILPILLLTIKVAHELVTDVEKVKTRKK